MTTQIIDEENFTDIVEKYQDMLLGTAISILKDYQLAEDCVQETWIKVHRVLANNQQIDKIKSWLRTIASRTAIDLLRKKNQSRLLFMDESCEIEQLAICSNVSVEEYVNYFSTLEDLQEHMSNSSEKLKKVFDLKFIKDYSDSEIAKILNISPQAVKTRVFRTRKLLQTYSNTEASILPGA